MQNMMVARDVSQSAQAPPAGIPLAIWNLPALEPPLGVESNFEHPQTRDREVIVINAIFLTLMILAVLMQFLIHRPTQSTRGVNWSSELAMCVLAACASVTHSALMITGLPIGFGRHLWDIRAITLTYDRLLRLNQISTMYIVAIFFAKLYVLLVYRGFFSIVRRTNILIWIGIAMNATSSLVYLALVIVQAEKCLGLEALFNSFCLQTQRISASQAAVNVFMDFYILFIPLQQIRHLKVSSRQRLGVAAVFSVGFLACAMSVVKLGWTIKNYHEKDTLYYAVLNSLTSSVEINIVIISPCLIFIPAFIKSSKSGISSMRTRFVTRTRSKESLGYSSAPGPDEKELPLRKAPSMELVFLQEPKTSDEHSERSLNSARIQRPEDCHV